MQLLKRQIAMTTKNIFDDDMLFTKVATIGNDNPTLTRLTICRFNVEDDQHRNIDGLKEKCLNLNIDPLSQNGDKSTDMWNDKGYIGRLITETNIKDIDYINIPKYIKAYCKKFGIDTENVIVWDDMNQTRDMFNKLNINIFKREQWFDINTALIMMGAGEIVKRDFHNSGFTGVPSIDVPLNIYGLLKFIHTGRYDVYNPDDDIPF